MRLQLVSLIILISICFILTKCKSRNIEAVQIVFFDLNNFERTDTLLIHNIDTVNSIRKLFNAMETSDAKFPGRYKITFLGKDAPETYYSNGTYVRRNRKIYVLPEGKEFILFESILKSKFKS
ncbi:hypothetical protein [Foetidibacter luteolus]|uniref:hypothetical protein n=1 Tax=Foetidibacter luteolus TaxID=2608880 RepID=UPI00129AFF8C|nr:hypothetical protein [Foetidibacter luteolus]